MTSKLKILTKLMLFLPSSIVTSMQHYNFILDNHSHCLISQCPFNIYSKETRSLNMLEFWGKLSVLGQRPRKTGVCRSQVRRRWSYQCSMQFALWMLPHRRVGIGIPGRWSSGRRGKDWGQYSRKTYHLLVPSVVDEPSAVLLPSLRFLLDVCCGGHLNLLNVFVGDKKVEIVNMLIVSRND